ncbi:MAG TPA: NAD-dependent epimerase/dehydratase family protein [Anaeromyxobacteraceae bacterium]|nr:NAD-dependent epimerase/dehydratase family protein [Anaeromyxobacteraceae bacterium]
MHVLVAGCGWLGTALARVLVARGDRVTGIRRDAGRAAALAPVGVEPLALDLSRSGAAARLPPKLDCIVACQSSAADSPEAYRSAYVDANRTLIEAASRAAVRAFVYTGSTGVFGQSDGRDVDEETPPAPASASGEVLAEAERLVLEASRGGLPACVVRLSGLYGPGRSGIVDRVRSGRLALGPGDGAWMNFCQLDDAVSFVLAALSSGTPGTVYHGSDANPAHRRDVVRWIAARLGIPPHAAGAAAGGAQPNRRVLSARSRAALGVTLAYPSFREGLVPICPPAEAGGHDPALRPPG